MINELHVEPFLPSPCRDTIEYKLLLCREDFHDQGWAFHSLQPMPQHCDLRIQYGGLFMSSDLGSQITTIFARM